MAELNASLAVSDQDAYLFAQGKWFQSHKKLGAHPAVQEDGVEGYHFAVWAPNAASVSVVGDFNNWDDTVNVSFSFKIRRNLGRLYSRNHLGSIV